MWQIMPNILLYCLLLQNVLNVKSNYVKISYMIAYNNLIGESICFLNSFSNQWKNVYEKDCFSISKLINK